MTEDQPDILFIQADQLNPRVLPGYGRHGGHAAPRSAVWRRGGVRERLLQLPALCPVALLDAGRDAAVARAGLRQRGGTRRRHPHHGALPAACGLSHHAVGQAAFRRTGHAARVSRAARPGALSHRLPLDAELGRGSHGLEQRLERRHPVRSLRAQHADGPRRGGALPGGVHAARLRTPSGSAAVLSARRPSPILTSRTTRCAGTGSATATTTSRCPRRRCCPRWSAISTASACSSTTGCSRATSRATTSAPPVTPILANCSYLDEMVGTLLDTLEATGLSRNTVGRGHRGPRRHARRAGDVVQEALLRPRGGACR